ncbi:ABC transporter ATP-binding protein [Gilvibacter sediminis]|uniref:ABC transporter ATP-binding protein n=1 Tax=Gilvibacter sediminis TaxID=379071 RepID=UPI002350F7DD|nr:ABC transporter ATP-binding protein [Gilvibacter sediminis]MDC7999227.1 ABC transporter ATP-binding protein [Gilvibacter sediminis]
MKELRYLNKFFIKYRGRLVLGLLITVVARIFALFIPIFLGNIIDTVSAFYNATKDQMAALNSELNTNILIIIGAALLSAFFTFLMRQTLIVISRYIEFDLKNEVFLQYERLSLAFYKQNRTGDLMSRISEDVSKVRMYVGPAVMYSATTVTTFVVTISYMIYTAPMLTLYAVTPLPILSVAIYKLSRAIHKRSTVVQEYLAKLTTFTQESFSGISVIKAYGIEPPTNASFIDLAEGSKDKNIELVKVQALFFPLMILLIGISNTLVVYIGGQQYINGQIDLGTIVEFLVYVNMLTWPVAIVGWVTSMVQQAEASQKRINEFLSQQPEIENPTLEPLTLQGTIAFNDVYFTYPDTGITALKGVSFNLKPGEKLAILGNTGSGKSTILELLGRLYDVKEGSITIDGKDLRELNLEAFRQQMGYVPQDAFLFSDTIANNIKFGKEEASEAEIQQAAKMAVVHDNIVDFSKGYDTILGERGITLSGGQKQRVSIARALIKSPKLLLLDDCLSAVDTETEEAILSNLEVATQDCTTLIVSHRVSSAKTADQIIVLEEGQILQRGTHQELLTQEGYYKDLYQKQLAEKEI